MCLPLGGYETLLDKHGRGADLPKRLKCEPWFVWRSVRAHTIDQMDIRSGRKSPPPWIEEIRAWVRQTRRSTKNRK